MAARIAATLGALLAVAGCAVPDSAAPQGFIQGSTLHTMNFGPDWHRPRRSSP